MLTVNSAESFSVSCDCAFDVALTKCNSVKPLVNVVGVLAQDYVGKKKRASVEQLFKFLEIIFLLSEFAYCLLEFQVCGVQNTKRGNGVTHI